MRRTFCSKLLWREKWQPQPLYRVTICDATRAWDWRHINVRKRAISTQCRCLVFVTTMYHIHIPEKSCCSHLFNAQCWMCGPLQPAMKLLPTTTTYCTQPGATCLRRSQGGNPQPWIFEDRSWSIPHDEGCGYPGRIELLKHIIQQNHTGGWSLAEVNASLTVRDWESCLSVWNYTQALLFVDTMILSTPRSNREPHQNYM